MNNAEYYTETGKKNEKTNSNCNQSFVYVLAVSQRIGGSLAERA